MNGNIEKTNTFLSEPQYQGDTVLGTFHQVGASFVTWCPCYIGGSFHQVGASFLTWCPCYIGWGKLCDMVSLLHRWVIPPGWGKLSDMVSLLHRWVIPAGWGKLSDMVSCSVGRCTIHYYSECTFTVVGLRCMLTRYLIAIRSNIICHLLELEGFGICTAQQKKKLFVNFFENST